MKLLVLPTLFPAHPTDTKGIFTLDYIQSVKKFAEVNVFIIDKHESKEEVVHEDWDGIKITRYFIKGKKEKNPVAKFLGYINWFSKGIDKAVKLFPDVDIMHAHGSVLYGNIARGIHKKLNVPYVITEHTGPFSKISGNRMNRYFAQRAWKKCAALLAVSHDLKNQILNSEMYLPEIKVTYNPVDTQLFSLAKNPDRSGFRTITFAGRLEDYKGGLRTLKAFHESDAISKNYKLVLMGDGPEMSAIKSYVSEHSLQNCVEIKGSVTKKMMADVFQQSSFFVFPSEHETFGLVIAEAMSCGLPVITSNVTAPAEQVDAESGLLVNPTNINEITSAINFMIEKAGQYNSVFIRQKVETRFGFDAFGKQLNDIYTKANN